MRSVVQAVGKRLGCGACLRSLRRLRCGRFRIEEALPLDRLEERIERDEDAEVLLSPAEVLDHLDAYDVQEPSEEKVRHGSPLRHEDLQQEDGLQGRIGEKFRILIQGELAAVAEARSDPHGVFLQPIRVLLRTA